VDFVQENACFTNFASHLKGLKGLKMSVGLHKKPISELQSSACHPAQVVMSHFNSIWYLIYLPTQLKGRVYLDGWLYAKMAYLFKTVDHTGTDRVWHGATELIRHNKFVMPRHVGCMWNGCSGHGLSGMGLLSILSFIHIAATFATGVSSAFLLRWYNLL